MQRGDESVVHNHVFRGNSQTECYGNHECSDIRPHRPSDERRIVRFPHGYVFSEFLPNRRWFDWMKCSNYEVLDLLMRSFSGALDRDEVCDTCSLSQLHCPGHLGHVTLPLPVFNPVYFRDLHKLLRGSCTSCHRLLSPPAASQLILAQMQVRSSSSAGFVTCSKVVRKSDSWKPHSKQNSFFI